MPATTAPPLSRAASVHMKAEEAPGTEFSENGLPARDFLGMGAKLGTTYYTKNRKTGATIALPVTEDRVGHWFEAWNRFKRDGIEVPVCLDHDVRAETKVGRVIDLQREKRPDGEWIRPKYRVRGAKNIEIAKQNHISLGLRPNYPDGIGGTHAEAMWHLAITPIPVVNHQGLLIDASRDGDTPEEEDVFLSLEPPTETTPAPPPATQAAPAAPVTQRSNPMTPEQRARLLAITGVPAETDDDALLSRAIDGIRSDVNATAKFSQDLQKWRAEQIEFLGAKEVALSRRETAMEEQIELSRQGNDFGNPPPKEEPSELLLSMAESSLVVAKENAVARGLHAKTADALFEMLHTDNRPNDLALSMASAEVHPFGVRLFNLLSGASVAPQLGKVAGFDRPPVVGQNDNGRGGAQEIDAAAEAQIKSQFSYPVAG